MQLQKFITGKELTYKKAAEQLRKHPKNEHKLNVHEKHLHAVATQGTKAGPRLVFLIEMWSDYQVTRHDLRADLWP